MKEYLPCSTPLCASSGLTTCQSRLPSAVRLLAISLPALNCCPDTTAPRSELTSATGILFTCPNGSQNAHRYSAPYTSGSSISTTIATRVIRLRPKRLISEPNASPASIVSPLRSGCGDRVVRGPARVVAHLLEIADHQNWTVRKRRQSDPQQKQFQIRQFDDVGAGSRWRSLAEHFGQLGPAGFPGDPRVPRCQPPALLGKHRLHGHRFLQLVDIGEGRNCAVPANRPRRRIAEDIQRAVGGLEATRQRHQQRGLSWPTGHLNRVKTRGE